MKCSCKKCLSRGTRPAGPASLCYINFVPLALRPSPSILCLHPAIQAHPPLAPEVLLHTMCMHYVHALLACAVWGHRRKVSRFILAPMLAQPVVQIRPVAGKGLAWPGRPPALRDTGAGAGADESAAPVLTPALLLTAPLRPVLSATRTASAVAPCTRLIRVTCKVFNHQTFASCR